MGEETIFRRESAIVVKVRLAPEIERFRIAHVPNAALGVPAHVTLVYPFMPADRLDASVRGALARVLVAHRAFAFQLSDVRHWPGTLYLAVDRPEPFEAIVRSLVTAFPEYPPYAGKFSYVPHVTIAEGEDRALERLAAPLPGSDRQLVTRVLLIAQDDDTRWRVRWRLALRRGSESRRA